MEYDKPYKYGTPVLISNWSDRQEAYPLDNPKPNYTGASHYRTFGHSNVVYVPKTTTQAQLETGLRKRVKRPPTLKHQVNFVTYPCPMNMIANATNRRVREYQKKVQEENLTSTYSEVYKPPKPLIVKPDCCDKALDPLLNRIPKSDFEMLPSSTNKFMDDHLTKISEGRRKINFLRQMRNSTYIFQQE